MPISPYLLEIRRKVGTDLLILPSVTALVWNSNDQILLVREVENGSWSLPGGIVDPGESPSKAMMREVWEETGIKVRPERIVGVFGGPEGFRRIYPNGDQVEFVDIVFECKAVGGILECRDGETIEARYFNIDELTKLSIAYPINLMTLIQHTKEAIFY